MAPTRPRCCSPDSRIGSERDKAVARRMCRRITYAVFRVSDARDAIGALLLGG